MNNFLSILTQTEIIKDSKTISFKDLFNKMSPGLWAFIIILIVLFCVVPIIISSIFANRSKEAKRLGFKTFMFFWLIIPLIVYILRVNKNYNSLVNKQDYEQRVHNIILNEWRSYQPILFWLIVNFFTGFGILVFFYHCNKLEKFINNLPNQQPNSQNPYNSSPNNSPYNQGYR